MDKQEFSPFQRYFNNLTFYLFELGLNYKHLEDYDEDGPFENHYKIFFRIKTKLSQKICDDEKLLINNNNIFKEYFETLSNKNLNDPNILSEIKKFNKSYKYEKNEILRLYFELSDNLPKSKIRSKGINLIFWSIPAFIFVFFIVFFNLFTAKNCIDFILSLFFFLVPFIILYSGCAKIVALKNKKITKFKFNNLFSYDYCFQKIKESEKFFYEVYKLGYDYYNISALELKFPEIGNLFERTINNTKLSDANRNKLLDQNKNLYVRATFSDFFESLSKEGVEQLQQIPFMFVATLKKANLTVEGNTGFAECINNLLNKSLFVDVTFNQARAKYTNEEDLFDKYRNILKKYENILQ